MKKLPIGIQNIERILLNGDYVYIDKTPFAYKLITSGSPHYFLSRPRRFGKSLFLDTLSEIFKGNKELFKDCAIYQTDYDWKPYPVVYMSLYKIPSRTPGEFEEGLKRALHNIAALHQLSIDIPTPQEGLDALVSALSKKYGQQVVVLIDEYDKPIINNLDNLAVAEDNREILREFFGTLKELDNHLKFTFVTGISKFSKVSLFSGANHLKDLTMHTAYADALGYTEAEILVAFAEHIEAVVHARNITQDAVLAEIKQWYNGYRFTEACTRVYNPFSTLNYLDERKPKSYWYSTGTPSFLLNELSKYSDKDLPLEELKATASDLTSDSSVDDMELKALMFQTGYLTVVHYDDFGGQYELGFPNQEVRQAFVHSLTKRFAPHVSEMAHACNEALTEHDLEAFFNILQSTISGFPYFLFSKDRDLELGEVEPESTARERTYHMMLLSLLKGMGFSVAAEVPTSHGSIDLVIQLPRTTYVIEVKLNRNAALALAQIHAKGYHKAFLNRSKQLVLLGLNFSSKARNIDTWEAELLDAQGQYLHSIKPLAE